MGNLKVTSLIIMIQLSLGQSSVSLLEPAEDLTDYYWREYIGVIPSDALPGGMEKSGKRTYIGQMYRHNCGSLPATIYEGSKLARASCGGSSFYEEDFVKILCTKHPDRYRWVPTKNEESQLLTNVHLVIGGNEGGYVLNIGRINHQTEIIIGKVFAHTTPFKGLSIPYGKDKEAVEQTYEILTYNRHYAYASHSCSFF